MSNLEIECSEKYNLIVYEVYIFQLVFRINFYGPITILIINFR
jgi:hypothetical protein